MVLLMFPLCLHTFILNAHDALIEVSLIVLDSPLVILILTGQSVVSIEQLVGLPSPDLQVIVQPLKIMTHCLYFGLKLADPPLILTNSLFISLIFLSDLILKSIGELTLDHFPLFPSSLQINNHTSMLVDQPTQLLIFIFERMITLL